MKVGVGAHVGLGRGVFLFVMAMACAGRLAAQSASVEALQSFKGSLDGTNPAAPVIQGSDGNFYGTTPSSGIYQAGTVYKITPAGVLTTLYTFTGGADGASPVAGLTLGSDGNFYGTTENGGDSNGDGTLFKITPAGVLTTLYTFTGGADGASPEAGLTQGSDGNFYGTTFAGASNGGGTVFKVTPAGVLNTLYAFTGGSDGEGPKAGLTQGSDGNFYGTTFGGGSVGMGTVFKITPAGVLTTLYPFTGGAGGATPQAGLTLGSDGNFYGTTSNAFGNGSSGTVFKVTPAGVLTTLYVFTGSADGASPEAGLTLGSDGNFYGTTFAGGNNEGGTVFKITPAGDLTMLHDFSGGTAGDQPEAGLTLGSDGNFYGTTSQGGGASGGGTVFKMTPAGALTALYKFSGDGYGQSPAGLIQGSDGNFYGTTPGGDGTNGDGTVFKMTPAGVLTTLYAFSGGADGASPEAGLTQGSDGNFYGTTARAGVNGANNGDGTVFEVTPAGVLSTLYTFTGGADGGAPEASLIQGSDGNFYGTTFGGGNSNGNGTVFKITPAGALTTLYTFNDGTDGAAPQAGLTLGSDGNFYGTTSEGGSSGVGTVFKITPAGVLTAIYSFAGGSDGASPTAGLTLGSDGNFYGTAEGGGSHEVGTVFKITPAGVLSPLYSFTGGADGENPTAGLTLGSDGNFYGTTSDSDSNSNGNGTVFEITPAGVLSAVYTFSGGAGGSQPEAGLTLGSDGNFYGTTNGGGQYNSGVVFRLTPAAPVAPPVVTSETATAQVGSAFSFQIVATNSPASFGASGLPAGLSVDAVAGLISGTPTQGGTFTVGLTATNSGGTGTGTLSLTVAPAPPQQPAILLTSPPIDETVITGSSVPVEATVSDPAGILSQVSFTLNGAAAAPAFTAAPFVATVVAPAPGTYVLQATATDNLGRQSTSSHTLTVIAAASDPAAPSAVLLTDVNGRKIGAGATIVVTCDATTADGSPIQQVNFYANGTLFASVDGNGNPIALSAGALVRDDAAASNNTLFQAAFQLPISASSLNSQYNLLAIAFSKLGTAQTSDTVTVTSVPQSVDQPPQIALAGLTSGQHLTTGMSYTASTVAAETAARATIASASDITLSTVAKIEYYLNKLELLNASVTGGSVPNFTFTAPAPGEYIVEAIATDTAGVASVADPITVQIDPMPVVTVSALGDATAVVGGKKAKVLISRTGDTSSELKVAYKLAGTAVDGVDYQLAPDSRKIVIPAGSASVKIRIEPIADPAAAGSLSAKIKLTAPASGDYTLGSPSKAKITILQH